MDNSGGFTTPPPPPPPPGGEGGAGGPGLPPRGIGEVLSTAFEIYKANAQNLLMIVAIVVVPLTFISAFIGGVVFAPETETVTLFGESVGDRERSNGDRGAHRRPRGRRHRRHHQCGAAGGHHAGGRAGQHRRPRRHRCVVQVGIRSIRQRAADLDLVGLAVLGGFILLIIPGIIFLVMFSVAIPALVVENLRGTDAMSRSWNLVKGSFWHALGLIIVAGIITAVVGGIVGAIGGAISDNWFVVWIFQAIAQIITAPFTALVSVLLYLDLRARREALSADGLRAS